MDFYSHCILEYCQSSTEHSVVLCTTIMHYTVITKDHPGWHMVQTLIPQNVLPSWAICGVSIVNIFGEKVIIIYQGDPSNFLVMTNITLCLSSIVSFCCWIPEELDQSNLIDAMALWVSRSSEGLVFINCVSHYPLWGRFSMIWIMWM